jgi:hypothetical protein
MITLPSISISCVWAMESRLSPAAVAILCSIPSLSTNVIQILSFDQHKLRSICLKTYSFPGAGGLTCSCLTILVAEKPRPPAGTR